MRLFKRFCAPLPNQGTVLPLLAGLVALLLSACGSLGEHANGSAVPDSSKRPLIQLDAPVATDLDIRTELVQQRELSMTLKIPAQIQPDVGKEIDVTTRFSGRVKDVRVVPGQFVSAGTILATVDSQGISELQAELIEAKAKLGIAEAHQQREYDIYQENLQRPRALIEARTRFDESKVQMQLAQSEFERLSGLYKEKISSAKDYIAARATYERAKAVHAQAAIDLQREERLYKNTALMKRDLQLAQAETARAKQHVNTLQQRLIFLGMQPHMVQDVLHTGIIHGIIPIPAPASGVVTHLGVAAGELITPETRAFTITDLGTVMVSASIPEVDLPRVKIGSPIDVKVASYPNEHFRGAVSYISELVNPQTRTVDVRARLPNAERKLKSNMFAEMYITGLPEQMLACPKSAVHEREGRKVVYVVNGNRFEEQQVETGRQSEEYFEIISGLRGGEKVATQGSLLLKTELMK